MPPVSDEADSRVRKNETLILNRLAAVGQKNVAKAIGKEESNFSKMISAGYVKQISTTLATLGLKAVPSEYRCIDPKTLETLLHGHRQWIGSIENQEQLTWD